MTLPLARARGPARGVRHRRARRRSAAPVDEVYRATYARIARAQPPLLRALPGGPRARAGAARAARRRGRAAADGRPPDAAPLPPGRQHARDERRRRGAALPARAARPTRPPSCTTSRTSLGVRAQPALRDRARGVLRRRRRHALVGRARACRPSTTEHAGAAHRRARLPVDVRGLRRAARRCARPPSCSPRTSGRGSTTPSGCAPTRSRWPPRSTPRTPTSSARSPRRPPRSSAALRAWVTSEYDHNGLRADGERILGRLIDLARGRI